MLHLLYSISSDLIEIMAAWLCCNLCLGVAAQYLEGTAGQASADVVCSEVQGITDEQAALQMGAWAIFAAPLIMGNDVRNLTKAQRNILLNKSVIAINQDPLGTYSPCTASCATRGTNHAALSSQTASQQMHVMLAVCALLIVSSKLTQLLRYGTVVAEGICFHLSPMSAYAGMQGTLVQCPGGCNKSQIWRRQLSGGIAVAFINLSSASVQELCISQSALEPLDTSALLEVLTIDNCTYCTEQLELL